MKQYFRFFSIPFIAVAILAIVTLVVSVSGSKPASSDVSGNTERTTEERVFDYADKLNDTEEEALREQIKEAEAATKCDIVIVTLNESLVEYAAQYEDQIGSVPIDQCVMVYADNFYDEHKFGYDEAHGDGVLFLDNWYRESDGWAYSWMSTSGSAEDKYSTAMIDDVIDSVVAKADANPYEAYSTFIKMFRNDVTGVSTGNTTLDLILQPIWILVIAVVIAVIFLIVNWSSKKGKKTTTGRTYVVGGNPTFRHREDRFLHKNVTKVKIERNSGSGGGGSHRSAGGHSHGGGGGRR